MAPASWYHARKSRSKAPVLVACLLSASSAALYSLTFPPVALGALAWIALVPFFLGVSIVRPRVAAGCGIVWGLVAAVGVGWPLPKMLTSYFGLSAIWSCIGFIAASLGTFAVYFAAFGAWLSWLARRGSANPLVVGAGWLMCEYSRANLLIPNPWALSTYSQMAFTRLIQIADATGPWGVSLLLGAVNACLAALLLPTMCGRRPWGSCAAAIALVAAALGYGQWRLSQTFTVGDPFRIAVVQGRRAEHPLDPTERSAALQSYVAATEALESAPPALVFWPENVVTFYLQEASPERDALLALSRELRADIMLGGPFYRSGLSEVHYFNSAFLLRSGRPSGRYDKVRLMPFAEGGDLRWLLRSRGPIYTPGSAVRPLAAAAARLGVLLCSEAMFPDLARLEAWSGAEVLVNLSNDGWFGYPAAARLQLAMSSLRAIENRRYLVRAATGGFSAVINPLGEIAAATAFDSAEVLSVSIQRSQALTPYHRFGDGMVFIAAVLVVGGSVYGAFRRRRRSPATGGRPWRAEASPSPQR